MRLSAWIVLPLLAAAPALARQQAVLEAPAVEAPLSPAVEVAPLPAMADAAAAGLAATPELPAALAEPAPGLVPAASQSASAAQSEGAREKAPVAKQGDGASLDDYLAGRQRFDNDEGFSNLFAAAQQAAPADKAYVDGMLARVKGRALYVDNNTMVFAMNGKPTWLYFFNKVPKVAVVPQVLEERRVEDDAVLKSVAKKKDGAEAAAEAARLSSIFRRREQRFFRYMGGRLRQAPSVDRRRRDALAAFLRTNISAKDSRVVAEIALSCGAGPCYFLTADDRLAQAVAKLDTKPFREKLDDFLRTQRLSDPAYPRPQWPAILSSRP